MFADGSDNLTRMIDLPDLPAQEIEVLRFIIRQNAVTLSRLRDGLPRFSEVELAEILANLERRGLLSVSQQDHDPVYRAHLGRRSAAKSSLKGIWATLDFDQSEPDIHPEVRRVRSPLADQLLAALDQPPITSAIVMDEAETRRQGQSLMDDLLSTGRTAMAKRNLSEPTPPEDADSLMSDLVAAGKSSAPKPEPEAPPSPSERRRLATVEFASIPRTPVEEEPIPQVAPLEPAVSMPAMEEVPTEDNSLLGRVRKFFGLGGRK